MDGHSKYSAGRRLLKWVGSGQRTRYCFSGLTEEIRKVSVGTHGSGNFAFDDAEDGVSVADWWVPSGGTASAVSSDTRRSAGGDDGCPPVAVA